MNLQSDNISPIVIKIIGAGDSIDLKTDWRFGVEFGIPIEEITALADNRLRLRCILPMPSEKDISQNINPIDNLDKLVQNLENFGWEVRLSDKGSGITSSLVVDNEVVFFQEKLSSTETYYSEKESDIKHYQELFKNYWETSFNTNKINKFYESELLKLETNQIIQITYPQWNILFKKILKDSNAIYDLKPRQFEELIAELLDRSGFQVSLTPQTRDGGKDIIALKDSEFGKQLYLVECKLFNKRRPVDVSIVRQLYGVLNTERATAGMIVTSSYFSKDALSFSEPLKYQLNLKNYNQLLNWIKNVK